MQGGDIFARTEIALIQYAELPIGIVLLDLDVLQGRRELLLVLGQHQVSYMQSHALDSQLQVTDCLADRERMVVELPGLERELVRLHPGECAEGHYEEHDGAQAEAQLRVDG